MAARDADGLQDKIRRLFSLAKKAVDEELNGHASPADPSGRTESPARPANGNGGPARKATPATALAVPGASKQPNPSIVPAFTDASFLTALLTRMAEDKSLPKYQFERRVDAMLAVFLPDLLSQMLGATVEFVVPEFPIKKAGSYQSINVDHVYCINQCSWLFVEIKTDIESIGSDQPETYLAAASREMAALIADVRVMRAYREGIGDLGEIIGINLPFSIPLVDADGVVLDKPLIGEMDLVIGKPGGQVICVDLKTAAQRYSESKIASDLQPTAYLEAARQHAQHAKGDLARCAPAGSGQPARPAGRSGDNEVIRTGWLVGLLTGIRSSTCDVGATPTRTTGCGVNGRTPGAVAGAQLILARGRRRTGGSMRSDEAATRLKPPSWLTANPTPADCCRQPSPSLGLGLALPP